MPTVTESGSPMSAWFIYWQKDKRETRSSQGLSPEIDDHNRGLERGEKHPSLLKVRNLYGLGMYRREEPSRYEDIVKLPTVMRLSYGHPVSTEPLAQSPAMCGEDIAKSYPTPLRLLSL